MAGITPKEHAEYQLRARNVYDNSKAGIAVSIGNSSTRVGWALLDVAAALREIAQVGRDYIEFAKSRETTAGPVSGSNSGRVGTYQ